MIMDYKKTVFIKKVDTNTGIIEYDFIYKIDKHSNVATEVKLIENSLNIVDRTPNSGDRLYFLNGVTVPRFKIKEYHKTKGTKVVKYIEASNLVVFSEDSIKEYFNDTYLYKYDRFEIISYLNNWIIDNTTGRYDLKLDDKWAYTLLEHIISAGEDVFTRYDHTKMTYFNTHGTNSYSSCSILYVNSDNYNRLQNIVNMKCDFIDQSIILKELNTNIVMDFEMYDSIQKLMNSSDKENMKIAMEMMANCDYDSSAMYLLLLLKKYNTEIHDMPNIKHVNFRAMLNYFGYTSSSSFISDTDDFIRILKARDILTKSQQDILIPMILEEYNSKPHSSHYKISMITFVDDEGEDIVVESELPEEPDGEILEAKSEEEVCSELYGVDNNSETTIEPYKGETLEELLEEIVPEVPELDDIIFDELTEAIGYCTRSGLSEQREWLTDVRDQIRSPDTLLKVIKFFDKDELSEYIASLTQCYLDMK